MILGWTLPRPGDWRFQDPENNLREERHIREERAKQRQTSYQQRYTGPHTITAKMAEDVYWDNQNGREIKVHGSHI